MLGSIQHTEGLRLKSIRAALAASALAAIAGGPAFAQSVVCEDAGAAGAAGATATGVNATACGSNARAFEVGSMALGADACSNGSHAIAIGDIT